MIFSKKSWEFRKYPCHIIGGSISLKAKRISTKVQLSIMDGFLNLVRILLHPHQVPLMHSALAPVPQPQMLPENQVGTTWQTQNMKVSYLLKPLLLVFFWNRFWLFFFGVWSRFPLWTIHLGVPPWLWKPPFPMAPWPRSDSAGMAHQEWASLSRNEELTALQSLLELGEQVDNVLNNG